ncbi:trihelix transcription factor GT-3a-like, partial [Ixodes scapularis]|uniref:trihelix transcription factor GT-3a-like n=1 Tax=Ixodes scapularis TaxID=6945 RepID=UPI001C3801F7
VQWGVHETWVLLAIWEDRLEDLRRAKRNFGVYADMAAKLAEAGFKKTVDQVHHKIENLSNTYRRHQRTCTTTGSGGITWPFYWEVHRILGSLPVNDSSLVEESDCSERVTPAVSELLSETQGSTPEEDVHWERAADVEDESADASTSAGFDSATASRRSSGSSSEATDEAQPRGPKRKRQGPSTAAFKVIMDRQAQLLASYEAARNREFELREQELAVQREALKTQQDAVKAQREMAKSQQDLAAAMMAFLNKASK